MDTWQWLDDRIDPTEIQINSEDDLPRLLGLLMGAGVFLNWENRPLSAQLSQIISGADPQTLMTLTIDALRRLTDSQTDSQAGPKADQSDPEADPEADPNLGRDKPDTSNTS